MYMALSYSTIAILNLPWNKLQYTYYYQMSSRRATCLSMEWPRIWGEALAQSFSGVYSMLANNQGLEGMTLKAKGGD